MDWWTHLLSVAHEVPMCCVFVVNLQLIAVSALYAFNIQFVHTVNAVYELFRTLHPSDVNISGRDLHHYDTTATQPRSVHEN